MIMNKYADWIHKKEFEAFINRTRTEGYSAAIKMMREIHPLEYGRYVDDHQ